jgi:Carboxypeptidase regulatory-like domain
MRLTIANGVFGTAVLLSVSTGAQGLSTIPGTVTDPSRAVVPAAQITVTQDSTSQTRTLTTDAQGYYVFPSLRPTGYTLAVKAAGLHTYSQINVILLADQNLGGLPSFRGPVSGPRHASIGSTPTLSDYRTSERSGIQAREISGDRASSTGTWESSRRSRLTSVFGSSVVLNCSMLSITRTVRIRATRLQGADSAKCTAPTIHESAGLL